MCCADMTQQLLETRAVCSLLNLETITLLLADVSVVQQLLAAGADPDARDMDGNTPLHACICAPSMASKVKVARVQALLQSGG